MTVCSRARCRADGTLRSPLDRHRGSPFETPWPLQPRPLPQTMDYQVLLQEAGAAEIPPETIARALP